MLNYFKERASLLGIAMLLFGTTVFGQGEATKWYFGDKIGLDFSTAPPSVIPGFTPAENSGDIMESATSISNGNGEFLFGTNGSKIFSSDLVQRGTLSNGSNWGTAQGAVIIPVPGSIDEYYLVSIADNGCSSSPAVYKKVTVNGTTGNNISLGAEVKLQTNGLTHGQLVLPKTDNAGVITEDFWLIHHEYGNTKFVVYEVTSAGIAYHSNPSAGSTSITDPGGCGGMTAYFKANACYNQFVYNHSSGNTTYLFDFDTETGGITAQNSVTIAQAYGVEFSKNGKYVYISSGTKGATPTIYSIPVTPGGTVGSTLGAPSTLGTTFGTIRGGCLQMGPDGNIYAASFNSWSGNDRTDYLGVIQNVETGGSFTKNYIKTTGKLGMGLPTFITSLVSSLASLKINGTSSLETKICKGDNVEFEVEIDGDGIAGVTWVATGANPGTQNGGLKFSMIMNNAGTTKIEVTVADACGRTRELDFDVETIDPASTAIINQSLTDCELDLSFIYADDVDESTVLWDLGDGNTSTDLSLTHQYATAGAKTVTLTFQDKFCGVSVSESIVVNPTITAVTGSADLAGCPNPTLAGSNSPSGLYKWYTDDPANGGQFMAFGNNVSYDPSTYGALPTNVWVEAAGTVSSSPLIDNRTNFIDWNASSGNTSLTVTDGVLSISEFKVNVKMGWAASPPTITVSAELLDASNNIVGTAVSSTMKCSSCNQDVVLNPSWVVGTGTYTVKITKTGGGSFTGITGSGNGSYSNSGVTVSGGASAGYKMSLQQETGGGPKCTSGSLVAIGACCVQTVPVISSSVSLATVCLNEALTLTVTNAPAGGKFQWYNADGTVDVETTNTTLTITTSSAVSVKDYWVVITESTACAASSGESNRISVLINDTPNAPTVTTPVTICEAAQLDIDVTPTVGATTYNWTGVNSYTATGATQTVIASASSAHAGTYNVTATKDGCVSIASDVEVTVTSNVTPTVVISSDVTSICDGDEVIFSIDSKSNEGSSPAYLWKLNGSNFSPSETVATLKRTDLVDSDKITLIMTSDVTCITSSRATSNEVTIIVATKLVPSLSITSTISPANEICAGDPVTFSIDANANLGSSPTYQWKSGGVAISSENAINYLTSGLINNEVISLEVTTIDGCVTLVNVTSNNEVIKVNNALTPSLTIEASETDICEGSVVTYSVIGSVGAGSSPAYQWKKGGVAIVSETGTTYTTTGLVTGDKITLYAENLSGCATSPNVTSNEVEVTVNTNLTPAVAIVSDVTTICEGEEVTFTIDSETNQGGAPGYVWKLNGSDFSPTETGATVKSTTLINGDKVSLELTSSEVCVTSATATSNEVELTVNTKQIPSVAITSTVSPVNEICAGDAVTFSINTGANLGSLPTYQWKSGGVAISSENGVTYSTSALIDSEVISLEVTTIDGCVTVVSVASNDETIKVNGALTPDITIEADFTTICTGSSVTFSIIGSVGLGATPNYQWKNADVTIASETAATYTTVGLADTDKITLYADNLSSCATAPNVTSNEIEIQVDANPSTPSVTDLTPTTCASDINLTANTPITGTGLWTVISGPGTLDDVNSPTSLVTGLDESTVTVLEWNVTNGVCPIPTLVSVTITKAGEITTPKITLDGVEITGTEVDLCKNSTYLISGNLPENVGETATWVVDNQGDVILSGTATDRSRTTTFGAMKNSSTFTWQISNTSIPGCTPTEKTIEFKVLDVPVDVSFISPTSDVCVGDPTMFTIDGVTDASKYNWTVAGNVKTEKGLSINHTFISSSVAVDIVVNAENGCGTSGNTTTSVTVHDKLTPDFSVTNVTATICKGSNATIEVLATNAGTSPTFTFDGVAEVVTSNNATNTLLPNATKTVTIVLTRGNSTPISCFTIDEVTKTQTVVVLDNPTVSISGDNDICFGHQASFIAEVTSNEPTNAGVTWFVNDSKQSTGFTFDYTPAASGTDKVYFKLNTHTVCELSGADSIQSVDASLFIRATPLPLFISDDTTLCNYNLPYTLQVSETSGTTPTEIVWTKNGEEITSSNDLSYQLSTSGTYGVSMKNGVCTSLEMTIAVGVQTLTIDDISVSQTDVEQDDYVELIADVSGEIGGHSTVELWTGLDNGVTINGNPAELDAQQTDYYSFYVKDNVTQCEAHSEDSVLVNVLLPIVIPNAITPNADGVNDTWNIQGMESYRNAKVSIYNRWGQLLYTNYGVYANDWDGTHNGSELPQATYYYIIELNIEGMESLSGDLSVIR